MISSLHPDYQRRRQVSRTVHQCHLFLDWFENLFITSQRIHLQEVPLQAAFFVFTREQIRIRKLCGVILKSAALIQSYLIDGYLTIIPLHLLVCDITLHLLSLSSLVIRV